MGRGDRKGRWGGEMRRGEGLDRVGTLSTHSKEVDIEKDLASTESRESREIVLVVSME